MRKPRGRRGFSDTQLNQLTREFSVSAGFCLTAR